MYRTGHIKEGRRSRDVVGGLNRLQSPMWGESHGTENEGEREYHTRELVQGKQITITSGFERRGFKFCEFSQPAVLKT